MSSFHSVRKGSVCKKTLSDGLLAIRGGTAVTVPAGHE